MKIVIHCYKPFLKKEIYVDALMFYPSSKTFSLMAGGYDIGDSKKWNVEKFLFCNGIHVWFPTVTEVEEFALWLEEMNKEVQESYTKMRD
ncbi:hypothetical protein A8990_14530 [Paenibacillus taihuensis]|uniref:Uncharacterized protein n=1 Tax=Paenibacillus taihuensis TaxID=1156355 RepID=A0A3D9R0Q4_9BACL|nr:hypothetical protein [Paenibacillus taihuensis]REE67021.1 hypothetical protein A8990_14530 [Paenibacillus taihuensis]